MRSFRSWNYMIFFFSSRRRHTILQGDWSSDVCSSDLWGRRAALDLAAVEAQAAPAMAPDSGLSRTLDELIERRMVHLVAYQDAAYAARYRSLVERVREADAALGRSALSDAVARYY